MDIQESTMSSTINKVNSIVPRFPTTSRTSSTIDGHHSSITEPSTGIDDAREESATNETSTGSGRAFTTGESVEEVSSAIANACTLYEC